MQHIIEEIMYRVYDSYTELTNDDRLLLERADEAAASAYAPYSNFKVGAAVLLNNGIIVTGSNQENAAYPSGLCAERVALFAAGASFPASFVSTIAVSALHDSSEMPHPVSPCGACRQVMAECENRYQKNIRLIMIGASEKIIVIDSVKILLPFIFNSASLVK